MRMLKVALLVSIAAGLGTAAIAQEYRGDSAPTSAGGRGDDAAAQYGKAVTALKAKDYATAERAARNVLIVEPRSAGRWRALGPAKAGAGEWNAALDGYRTALAFPPNDPSSGPERGWRARSSAPPPPRRPY